MSLLGRRINTLLALLLAGVLALSAVSVMASAGSELIDEDGAGTFCDSPDAMEFQGTVISVSQFGLALRTDSDVVFVLYTQDTVFEDSTGPISKDSVVSGVSAFVLAVPSQFSNSFEALLVYLLADGEGPPVIDCGGDDDGTGGHVDENGDEDVNEEENNDVNENGDEDANDENGDTDNGDEDNGNGAGTGHEQCFAATEHARSVLESLLDGSFFVNLDLPENADAGLSAEGQEGVAKSLEAINNCGTGADEADKGDDADNDGADSGDANNDADNDVETEEHEDNGRGRSDWAPRGRPDNVPQGPPNGMPGRGRN